jgi:hypothetical protein
MLRTIFSLCLTLCLVTILVGCKETPPDPPTPSSGPYLVFKFKFDSTQVRLNNLGLPSTLPAGHGAFSPKMNKMAAHYIELTPSALTPFGSGMIAYKGKETTAGGANAILFDSLKSVAEGEVFYKIPIANVTKNDYEYLRVSLAYQNYEVPFKYNYLSVPFYFQATLASFLGFNNYISSYTIKNQSVTVNDDKKQGYWGFEIQPQPPYLPSGSVQTGAAAVTTVVNPIQVTSPIPVGSCVVTGKFASKLSITGNETQDVVVTVSLSTNKSFEWIEVNPDGKFEPAAGEAVVDMGVRGMIPSFVK